MPRAVSLAAIVGLVMGLSVDAHANDVYMPQLSASAAAGQSAGDLIEQIGDVMTRAGVAIGRDGRASADGDGARAGQSARIRQEGNRNTATIRQSGDNGVTRSNASIVQRGNLNRARVVQN